MTPLLTALLLLAQDDGFKPIFDGTSLDGWVPQGGGKWSVEEGAILGLTGTGEYGWLCSAKTYGDFILEFDTKHEGTGNSGVQARSRIDEKGVMIGYQFDLDRTRPSSGRLYDEARRKLLQDVPDDPISRGAFKAEDWNKVTIRCEGDRLRSWINQVPIVDYVDSVDLEGLVALQVHSGRDVKVRFRNVRIKDLGRRKWKPLFNGKTFEGWHPIGKGEWSIADGVITGRHAKAEKEFGHMVTDAVHRDFSVRLQFRSLEGDSGFYFRSEEKGALGMAGLQAQIHPKSDAGGLYCSDGRGWVLQPKKEDVAKGFKPGEWNSMTVSARGTRVAVNLNDWRTAELLKDERGRLEGRFALQLHGDQDLHVQFREIQILGDPE